MCTYYLKPASIGLQQIGSIKPYCIESVNLQVINMYVCTHVRVGIHTYIFTTEYVPVGQSNVCMAALKWIHQTRDCKHTYIHV